MWPIRQLGLERHGDLMKHEQWLHAEDPGVGIVGVVRAQRDVRQRGGDCEQTRVGWTGW